MQNIVHLSEPNYIWLEAGDNLGITDDNNPSLNHQATTDHLVTYLEKKGISWTSWQEDITGTECPLTSIAKYASAHPSARQPRTASRGRRRALLARALRGRGGSLPGPWACPSTPAVIAGAA
jgi:hypothetical protein